MKVDLSKPLLDLEGREIKEGGKTLTYQAIFRMALVGDYDQEKSSTEKFDDFKIAIKLKEGDTDLTVDDISRIKKLVGKIPSTLVVGRTIEFIDNIGK